MNMKPMEPILCLDVGSGTQDALLYFSDRELENCPKFVLPAPARLVGGRLRELTRAGKGVWLYGRNMGGGFYQALKAHLAAGLPAACQPQAAYALFDDPSRLLDMGVALEENCPRGFVPLYLSDFEPAFWRGLLAQADLPYPAQILVAAQDHGFHPAGSNRLGRFALWRRFLDSGGALSDLVHEVAPPVYTRLTAIQESTGGGPVADTGAAAILGAIFDPDVAEESGRQGVCLVNLGNSHALAFLLFAGRVLGVYEQHTGALSPEEIWDDLERFRRGELDNQDVLDRGGHGAALAADFAEAARTAGGFEPMHILGPRRNLLRGRGVRFPAPGGDMMLAGCFGLLEGLRLKRVDPAE